jgi:hypothetical protein
LDLDKKKLEQATVNYGIEHVLSIPDIDLIYFCIKEGHAAKVEKIVEDQYLLEVEYFSAGLMTGKEPIYLLSYILNNIKVIGTCLNAV